MKVRIHMAFEVEVEGDDEAACEETKRSAELALSRYAEYEQARVVEHLRQNLPPSVTVETPLDDEGEEWKG